MSECGCQVAKYGADRSTCKVHSDAALAAKDERIRELEAANTMLIANISSHMANTDAVKRELAQLRQQVEAETREADAAIVGAHCSKVTRRCDPAVEELCMACDVAAELRRRIPAKQVAP